MITTSPFYFQGCGAQLLENIVSLDAVRTAGQEP